MANTTSTPKKEAKFESVKKLNAIVQSGETTALIADFKDLRMKIDALIKSERAKVQQIKQRKVELDKKQEDETMVSRVKPELKKEVSEDTATTVVSVPKEKPTEKPKKDNSATSKTASKPISKEKVIVEPKKPEIRTKTIDNSVVPNYIRGVMTPSQKTAIQPTKPNRDSKKNTSQSNKPNQNGPRNSSFERKPIDKNKNEFRTSKPSGTYVAEFVAPVTKERKQHEKKKDNFKPEDKKSMNKRTLIRKGFITEDVDEDRMGTRKLKNKKTKPQPVFTPIKITKAVITTENLTVKILSEKIGKTAQEIIKQLMLLGIMTNINSVVDFPTMELVANELGVELELKLEQTQEAKIEAGFEEADDENNLVKRPPIITVMGHVDHGKTSLLDAIRKTAVASGEAGGITQHIGAYSVMCKGEKITFLDTPGHEAFTEMRARGAKVTDIAVLIVAADDGVMPQTVEAINHAKAAKVPILVAINKIDKPGANPDKVKQDLMNYDLVPEEWGGETIMVPVSAKTGEGLDKLLEMILLLSEYNNYRANPARKAKCSIIEAKLDKGKGPIANIIVMNGTLHTGDFVVSGMTFGRIRAMVDDKGRTIKEATPSTPVSVLGFTDVPQAGDVVYVVDDEKTAKQVVDERNTKLKNNAANQGQKITLDDVFNKISEGNMKELNILIKADVQGSVEALKNSLIKLSNDEVKVNVVHGGVGAINKSDLMLAEVSNAIIIGFNVRPDAESKTVAENKGIDIRLYRVIYEAIDDVQNAMKGLIAPKTKETVLGRALVKNIIKIPNVGFIAGSYVKSGKILRNSFVRIYRDNVVVFDGKIDTLKRFKDDVKEVATGFECGISVENFDKFQENDEIESYILEEVRE